VKTRQQVIDEFRHGVSGIWLDVVYRRPEGSDLSIAIRSALTRIDTLAAAFYDEVKADTKAPQNGVATTVKK
jgi:hypothetical protein